MCLVCSNIGCETDEVLCRNTSDTVRMGYQNVTNATLFVNILPGSSWWMMMLFKETRASDLCKKNRSFFIINFAGFRFTCMQSVPVLELYNVFILPRYSMSTQTMVHLMRIFCFFFICGFLYMHVLYSYTYIYS